MGQANDALFSSSFSATVDVEDVSGDWGWTTSRTGSVTHVGGSIASGSSYYSTFMYTHDDYVFNDEVDTDDEFDVDHDDEGNFLVWQTKDTLRRVEGVETTKVRTDELLSVPPQRGSRSSRSELAELLTTMGGSALSDHCMLLLALGHGYHSRVSNCGPMRRARRLGSSSDIVSLMLHIDVSYEF